MTTPAIHDGERPFPVATSLAIHPGSRWVRFPDRGSNTLVAASERTTPGTPIATDVTPDGRLLAIDAYEDNRVTFLDLQSLDVVARAQTGASPHHPRFSADARVCYGPSLGGDTVAALETAPLQGNGGMAPVVTTTDFPEGTVPSGCFRTNRRGFQ